ncbi:MAG: hypothetical protein KC964_27445, partial [Candidatus Omnitrophica bacterium]|nr:hypothetical protein [Candidatus Omnitrophota bacterium]
TMDAYVPGRETGTLGAQKHDRLNVFHGFGTIGEWLYRNIGGINPDTDPANAGFKHFIIRPQIGGDLTCADVSYDSVRGTIRSHWWIEDPIGPGDNEFYLQITVPPNTTATVFVPGIDLMNILLKESGGSEVVAAIADGVEAVYPAEDDENVFVFQLESGNYTFLSPSSDLFPSACTGDCPCGSGS